MRRLILLTQIAIWLAAVATSAAPKYTVTVLPITPIGINNKEHITGMWQRPRTKIMTAVLYADGRIIDLDPKDKFDPVFDSRKTISAGAINDRDEVIGSRWASGAVTATYPFFWAKGKIHELSDNGGFLGSVVNSINNKSQMVGSADSNYHEDMGDVAVYWPNSKAIASNFGKKMGWRHSKFMGINDYGDMVGGWQDKDDKWHAFLLSKGHITNIELPGAYSELFIASVNDKKQIVGVFCKRETRDSATERAFMWQNGKLADLGYSPSQPSLNNRGEMVGCKYEDAKHSHPFYWRNGRYWDLNKLITRKSGVVIECAVAINDRGEIIATGQRKGKDVGLLLRPALTAKRH